VWDLYRLAHQLTGGVSTLLEWDARIPPFPVLHDEVLKAKRFMGETLPAEPEGAENTEADQVAAAGSLVPHPLHHIRPEIE